MSVFVVVYRYSRAAKQDELSFDDGPRFGPRSGSEAFTTLDCCRMGKRLFMLLGCYNNCKEQVV